MINKNQNFFYKIFECLSICIITSFFMMHGRTMLSVDPDTGRPFIFNDEDPVQVQKMRQHQSHNHTHNQQSNYQAQYSHPHHHDQEDSDHQKLQQKHHESTGQAAQAAQSTPPVKPEPDPIVPTHGLELKGCLRVAGGGDKKEKVPEYRIYFNGRQTMNNCEGFYSFPIEKHEINKLSLVICKGFKHNVEQKNTIKNVSIIPDKNYQYFTHNNMYSNSYNTNSEASSWVRCDQRFNHENFVIPENCVVILLDPTHVDVVTEWGMQLGQRFTKLPVISLKGAENLPDLKHESAKSLLSSLDAKIFHEPINHTVKVAPHNPKIHMSLAQ